MIMLQEGLEGGKEGQANMSPAKSLSVHQSVKRNHSETALSPANQVWLFQDDPAFDHILFAKTSMPEFA